MFVSNREIDETLQRYDPTHPEDEELWITDISWREPATDLHLDSLIGRGLKSYWVDHHKSAIHSDVIAKPAPASTTATAAPMSAGRNWSMSSPLA